MALQCAVIKGGLPLTLTWLKEGASVSNLAGLSVKLINDFTVSLTVETLSWQHSGHYTCWAQNEGGRAEASVAVIVQGKDGQERGSTWRFCILPLPRCLSESDRYMNCLSSMESTPSVDTRQNEREKRATLTGFLLLLHLHVFRVFPLVFSFHPNCRNG